MNIFCATFRGVIAREQSDRGNPHSLRLKEPREPLTRKRERIATPVCELVRNDTNGECLQNLWLYDTIYNILLNEVAFMSRADELYRATCLDILENGFSDEGLEVRPHWPDGTPAHTIKKFGVVNRYDLAEEFPIMTLRRTYWKSAVDELLWIWQKKSNRIDELGSHVWDEWAGDDGTIGKAYGYQLGIKYQYPEGEFDQVDRVLYDLKNNPNSRRILTSIYNFNDLHEMNLYPCAYSMTFNVSGNVLNGILNQRSQDMLTANNWNVVQYAVLMHMMAQVSGLKVGELVHVIADCHIYDRHIPMVKAMLENEGFPAPKFSMDESITDFYAFTKNSFKVEDYQFHPFDFEIPMAI